MTCREKGAAGGEERKQDQCGAREAEPRLQHPRHDVTDQAPGGVWERDLQRVKAQGFDSARAGQQDAKAGEPDG